MPEIELSQGLVALVDASDYALVRDRRWYAARRKQTFYAVRHSSGPGPKLLYMHRVILPTAGSVDHINGNGLDNRRANLRPANGAQNAQNSRKRRAGTSSSRYKGVSLKKSTGRWAANIGHGYRQVFLGYFDREEDAAQAYDEAARDLFGEFARLNFPLGGQGSILGH